MKTKKKNSMKKTMEANEHRKQIKCENEAKRFFLTKRQLSFQTAQVLPYGHFKQPHHFQNQNQQWKIMLEPVCCKKRQKSPNQETDFGNMERLKVLNDTKLVLNEHE